MNMLDENQNPELQKSEGKTVTIPIGLWECMAGSYFADNKTKYKPGSSGGETVTLTEGIFWKVARAYYGDGFSLSQETGRMTVDTGGMDSEPATEVKRYRPVPGPTAIPRGNLARIAAAHGIQSQTDKKPEGSSGDNSDSRKP